MEPKFDLAAAGNDAQARTHVSTELPYFKVVLINNFHFYYA
jgi:hypothetical protein